MLRTSADELDATDAPAAEDSVLVRGLNSRFAHGAPSADLSKAGVLARVFDASSDPNSPWRNMCAGDTRSEASPPRAAHMRRRANFDANPFEVGDAVWAGGLAAGGAGAAGGGAAAAPTAATGDTLTISKSSKSAGISCADRIPASLISKRLPAIYTARGSFNGGVLLQPESMRVRCSYAHDGFSNTLARGCPEASCSDPRLSGCASSFYCRSLGEQLWWKCGWRANATATMLTAHQSRAGSKAAFNEVVIEAADLRLPVGIAAFFYAAAATPTQREAIAAAHQAFCNRFARSHAATPLLEYDPDPEAVGGSGPFREVNLRL